MTMRLRCGVPVNDRGSVWGPHPERALPAFIAYSFSVLSQCLLYDYRGNGPLSCLAGI